MTVAAGPAARDARLPPQNVGAVEAALEAILLAGACGRDVSHRVLEKVRASGLEPRVFYPGSHGRIYGAAVSPILERSVA